MKPTFLVFTDAENGSKTFVSADKIVCIHKDRRENNYRVCLDNDEENDLLVTETEKEILKSLEVLALLWSS